MAWEIEYADEFAAWWDSLNESEQESVEASVRKLSIYGPMMGRPDADTLYGSQFPNMKELRTRHHGRPLRTLFAFDPRRSAILLIGGDKTSDGRFYERMVPEADRLYDAHLAALAKEGLV